MNAANGSMKPCTSPGPGCPGAAGSTAANPMTRPTSGPTTAPAEQSERILDEGGCWRSAMAIANSDSAAASLTSDSPVRIDMRRLGRLSLWLIATAVNRIGGGDDRTEQQGEGQADLRTRRRLQPTAKAVMTTIATPRPRM